MTHDAFRERIGPLLDGELDAAETEQVERHLAACPGCRRARAEMAALSLTLRSLPSEPMPDDLRASMRRRALQTAGRGAPWGALARPWALASMASAALLVVIAVITLRPDDVVVIPGGQPAAEARPPTIQGSPGADAALEKELPGRTDTATGSSQLEETPAPRPQPVPSAVKKDRTDDGRAKGEQAAAPRQEPAHRALQPEGEAVSGFAAGVSDQTKSSGPARYAMTLARQVDGRLLPGEIVPLGRLATGEHAARRRLEPQAVRVGASASDAPAVAPAPPGSASGIAYQGPPVTMTLLLRLDPAGRVITADPVGARVVSADTARAVVDLLIGSSIRPRLEDEPALVVLEISLPGAP